MDWDLSGLFFSPWSLRRLGCEKPRTREAAKQRCAASPLFHRLVPDPRVAAAPCARATAGVHRPRLECSPTPLQEGLRMLGAREREASAWTERYQTFLVGQQ